MSAENSKRIVDCTITFQGSEKLQVYMRLVHSINVLKQSCAVILNIVISCRLVVLDNITIICMILIIKFSNTKCLKYQMLKIHYIHRAIRNDFQVEKWFQRLFKFQGLCLLHNYIHHLFKHICGLHPVNKIDWSICIEKQVRKKSRNQWDLNPHVLFAGQRLYIMFGSLVRCCSIFRFCS